MDSQSYTQFHIEQQCDANLTNKKRKSSIIKQGVIKQYVWIRTYVLWNQTKKKQSVIKQKQISQIYEYEHTFYEIK